MNRKLAAGLAVTASALALAACSSSSTSSYVGPGEQRARGEQRGGEQCARGEQRGRGAGAERLAHVQPGQPGQA